MKKHAQRTLLATLIASGLTMTFAQTARGAEDTNKPAAPKKPDEAVEMETVVVTGSHVPTTRDAVAVSVIEPGDRVLVITAGMIASPDPLNTTAYSAAAFGISTAINGTALTFLLNV